MVNTALYEKVKLKSQINMMMGKKQEVNLMFFHYLATGMVPYVTYILQFYF